jgi:hypothetical protein
VSKPSELREKEICYSIQGCLENGPERAVLVQILYWGGLQYPQGKPSSQMFDDVKDLSDFFLVSCREPNLYTIQDPKEQGPTRPGGLFPAP